MDWERLIVSLAVLGGTEIYGNKGTGSADELNLLSDLSSLQVESNVFDVSNCVWNLNVTVPFLLYIAIFC